MPIWRCVRPLKATLLKAMLLLATALAGPLIGLTGCASAPEAAHAQAGAIVSPPDATPSSPDVAGSVAPTPSTQPVPAQAIIDLQGQISIKLLVTPELPAKGVSLGFFFHGQPEAGQLDLMTPLGSQIAQVGWGPTGAWLRRDGASNADAPPESRFGTNLSAPPSPDEGVERFDSIQALSERALGEAIPLHTLIHWMQGRADPARASTHAPEDGLAAGTFSQDGWLIDARDWPRRLQAQRTASEHLRGIQIKVHFDR